MIVVSKSIWMFIRVFSDALRSENFVKTLNAFISKLHFENGSQDFLGTTWLILFVQIDRAAYVKQYYLMNQEVFF